MTRRRGAAVALTGAFLLACVSGHRAPHPGISSAWKSYQELPPKRALAIAGDPRRDRWVAGATGGHASRKEAEAEALLQCRRRRAARRMQAACMLYAVGDEVVWSGGR